jgi:hypothetical protein
MIPYYTGSKKLKKKIHQKLAAVSSSGWIKKKFNFFDTLYDSLLHGVYFKIENFRPKIGRHIGGLEISANVIESRVMFTPDFFFFNSHIKKKTISRYVILVSI